MNQNLTALLPSLKLIELGIKVPECLEGKIPYFLFTTEFNKYSYTTFAEFYAVELPLGMNKTVREYVLDDLFKGVDRIVFIMDYFDDTFLPKLEELVATY